MNKYVYNIHVESLTADSIDIISYICIESVHRLYRYIYRILLFLFMISTDGNVKVCLTNAFPFLHFLRYNLLSPIMWQKSRVPMIQRRDPIENQGYAIMCSPIQNPPTPGHFQLSRNYCPSALRSSVNIFPFMLGSSRKEHKGAGSFTAELRRTD